MSYTQLHARYEDIAGAGAATHVPNGRAVPYGDLAALERDLERRRPERRAAGQGSRAGSVPSGVRELCHDLRQPVAAARALLHQLHVEARPAGVAAERLRGLEDQLDALSHLLEAQLRPPEQVPVDLGLVAGAAADVLAPGTGARVGVEVSGRPVVLGDPVLLQRMVTNLLDNACRAVRPGGRVRLRASSGDGEVLLEVDDDGSAADREGGTGLGLLIVESALTRHGGRAVTRPSALGGLCVQLRLPGCPDLPLEPPVRGPRR